MKDKVIRVRMVVHNILNTYLTWFSLFTVLLTLFTGLGSDLVNCIFPCVVGNIVLASGLQYLCFFPCMISGEEKFIS